MLEINRPQPARGVTREIPVELGLSMHSRELPTVYSMSGLMLPMFGSNLNRTCLNRYLRCGSAGFRWVRFGVQPLVSCSERVRTSVHTFEPIGDAQVHVASQQIDYVLIHTALL